MAYFLVAIIVGMGSYIITEYRYSFLPIPRPSYGDALRLWFFEPPIRADMWAAVLLTVFGLSMSIAYFCGLGKAKTGGTVLCVAGTLVAGALWLISPSLAIFFTFPLLYSIPLAFIASAKK